VDGLFWDGDSHYHGLQIEERGTLGHALAFQLSYTWGKSIDTGSATIAGDQFANSVSSLPWYDLRLNRGVSDFNIGQVLSIHLTYELPSPRGAAGRWYAKGWRSSATFQKSTGAPFTPVIGGDPLGTRSTDPYDVPNAVVGGNCTTPLTTGNPAGYLNLACFAFPIPATLRGNLGRNSITGPGLTNVDAAIFKDNFLKRLSETANVQLRVEVFNTLNHANFAPPLDHRTIFDQNGRILAGAGLIDTTSTPSRQMQVGLRLIW
jgi:hypothetical protein